MRMRVSLPILAAALAACAGTTEPAVDPTAAVERLDAAPAAQMEVIGGHFIGRARCEDQIGDDIWFGGWRELRRSSKGNGGRAESFVVNDFHGWLQAVDVSNYQGTAYDFEVLGGAEMFSYQLEGTRLVTRIHEGTLVFVSLDGTRRIVVRHVINNNPTLEQPDPGRWICREVG